MKYKGIPIDEISLPSTPAVYLELLVMTIRDHLISVAKFAIKRAAILTSVLVVWLLVAYLPALQTVENFVYFAAYWVILGVASSIGLGTGLHTFVLYLGPHIAKVAIASTHCGYVP